MKHYRGKSKSNKKGKYKGLGNSFIANEEQLKWDKYCISNDIRISPHPTSQGIYPEEWRISISFGSDYKKIYKTPTVYTVENIWEEIYDMKRYYYDKRKI